MSSWADREAPAAGQDPVLAQNPVVIVGSGHSGVAVAAGLRTVAGTAAFC